MPPKPVKKPLPGKVMMASKPPRGNNKKNENDNNGDEKDSKNIPLKAKQQQQQHQRSPSQKQPQRPLGRPGPRPHGSRPLGRPGRGRGRGRGPGPGPGPRRQPPPRTLGDTKQPRQSNNNNGDNNQNHDDVDDDDDDDEEGGFAPLVANKKLSSGNGTDDDDDNNNSKNPNGGTTRKKANNRKMKPLSLSMEIEEYREQRRYERNSKSIYLSWMSLQTKVILSIIFFILVVTIPIVYQYAINNNKSNNKNTTTTNGNGNGNSSNKNKNGIDSPGIVATKDNDGWIPGDESCDWIKFNQTFEDMMISMGSITDEKDDNGNDDNVGRCDARLMKLYHSPTCPCENPLIGKPMENNEIYKHIGDRWQHGLEVTKQRIIDYGTSSSDGDADDSDEDEHTIDVALVGDSIVEHWAGTAMGVKSPKYENTSIVFNELFTRDGGGEINGIVLGISASRCHNILYQFQKHNDDDNDNDDDNGMLIPSFQPKVFWILIGTNDIGGDYCSVEATVSGIIAIVEEIQNQRPNSIIVINSILPRPKPLFPYIMSVNERLECYADMTEGVEYFDATSIFYDENDDTFPYYEDDLHPTSIGHRHWGNLIVDKVLELTR